LVKAFTVWLIPPGDSLINSREDLLFGTQWFKCCLISSIVFGSHDVFVDFKVRLWPILSLLVHGQNVNWNHRH
jgi:hypothetical protein